MNYERIYNKLIERAKQRTIDGYQERHHIIPKCLGGNNDHENVVGLTPEEHFLAHQLLVKMHPNNQKLIYACDAMTKHNSQLRINNKMYGWLKRKHSTTVSTHFRNHWKDSAKREKHIESMLKSFSTEQNKENRSKMMKKIWDTNPERKEQIRDLQKTNNANVANRNRELWKDPDYKNKMKIARSGIVWWTNGIIDIKSKVQPSTDFYRGRSAKNLGRKKNETVES